MRLRPFLDSNIQYPIFNKLQTSVVCLAKRLFVGIPVLECRNEVMCTRAISVEQVGNIILTQQRLIPDDVYGYSFRRDDIVLPAPRREYVTNSSDL